jgi:lysozyme
VTIFGCDVAGYQGLPDWPTVKDAGISFAFSKVTQSTGYVNPSWSHNLPGMLALGSGFVPGAYHFLQQGTDPVAQARYFFAHLDGRQAELAIALDVEPTTGSRPAASQARAWVAEFKRLTGGHPVIGYFPGWYWSELGNPDLSFFDTLWQSHYVTASGSAAHIYGSVPASWWAPYGGERVSVLQYTDKASVPGISGGVDANAFRGTVADLRALALGAMPPPQPNITEDDMPTGMLLNGSKAVTPISLKRGAYKTIGFMADDGLQALPIAVLRVAVHDINGWHVTKDVKVSSTIGQTVITFPDPATTNGISVQRSDAGTVNVAWEVS